MGAFRNNQRPAPNPRIVDDLSPGFWGLSAIGGMTAAQAETTLDEYVYPYPGEVEGSTAILTQVIDWPFAEDDAGVPFDQANLYGVRTRCWRIPLVDGGGDRDSWTAVPKILPAEYTAVGRCGIVYGVTNMDLGENCANIAPTWNHRTATGMLLDPYVAEDFCRTLWAPRNFNQQVMPYDMYGAAGYIIVDPMDGYSDLYIYYHIETNHVGFRGGRMYGIISWYGGSDPQSEDVTFACQDETEDVWVSGAVPSSVKDLATISLSMPGGASPGYVDIDELLPDITPDSNGIVKRIFAYSGPYAWDEAVSLFGYMQLQLSPRTDVPLWYFASTRNRVAPGGIIQPP